MRLFCLFLLLSNNSLIGQTIKDFSLPNAADQSMFSLSSYNKAKGIVVIFTSNNCPYSKLYEKRIVNLYEDYASRGLEILLINPNNPDNSPEDGVSKMKSKAAAQNYLFPYLADKDQKVSTVFGAKKTPEVFLLKPQGGQYQIVYKGSFDNNPQNADDVSDPYLIRAVENLLGNKPISISESRPVGCIIKT